MTFEQWLQARQFDIALLTSQELTFYRACFEAENGGIQAQPAAPVGVSTMTLRASDGRELLRFEGGEAVIIQAAEEQPRDEKGQFASSAGAAKAASKEAAKHSEKSAKGANKHGMKGEGEQSSKDAHQATQKASKSFDRNDHAEAAKSHEKAATEHEKAANRPNADKGHKEAAQAHRRAAFHHSQAAGKNDFTGGEAAIIQAAEEQPRDEFKAQTKTDEDDDEDDIEGGGINQPTATEADDDDDEPVPVKPRTMSGVAYTGGAMKPQSFGLPVVVDLEGLVIPNQRMPMPLSHDMDKLVGHTESAVVSAQRIKVTGTISGTGEHAHRVVSMADNGFPWQMSIGADPRRMEYVGQGSTVKVNGRNFSGPMYVARETVLGEVSIVPLGADLATSANVANAGSNLQLQGADTMTFIKWLEARGKSLSTLTVEEITTLRANYQAEVGTTSDTPANNGGSPPISAAAFTDQIAAAREAAAQESERQTKIRAHCQAYGVTKTVIEGIEVPSLEAHALRHGWTPDQTELHALRASRAGGDGAGPNFYVPSKSAPSDAILEAAVLQAGNCPMMESDFWDKHNVSSRLRDRPQREIRARYTDEVQQRAHDLYHGRIGLQQVLLAGAISNGYRDSCETIRDDGQLEAVLRANNYSIRADGGSSTINIGNVLANVQNKYLGAGYLMVETAWREICAVRPVKDFKATKTVNMFGDVMFRQLGPNGEIDSGTLSDQAFANQIATYARILRLDRRYIINDDLGALTTVPLHIGRGGALKVNDLVWTIFLNPGNADDGLPFWGAHASGNAQPNLLTGAGTALSHSSLQAAETAYVKQVDPQGFPLGADAEILLHPQEISVTANELYRSENLVGPTSAKQGQKNMFAGKYRPVMSRYLSNASYTGYSTTAWWLLANPGLFPVVEVAFLNGQEMPTVQTAQANFQTLGIDMRGFSDVGANIQNFRGGLKNAGV